MVLSELTIQKTVQGAEASWLVDGAIMRVLYHDTAAIPFAADMALASCLVPAMQLHQDIELDKSFIICEKLLQNLELFQTIFSNWFSTLRKANITTAISSEADQNILQAVTTASFFSGGVDASYTFLSEQQQIDTLLFCYGLDIQLNETKRFTTAKQEGQKFANYYGKKLCIVETNFRDIFPTDSYYYSQTVVLIGFALGLGFKRLLVPASHTLKQLEPFGSHPMTDPLISHGYTEVLHHGMAPRTLKTKLIADCQPTLDILRVCNASPLYNCGECEKCLRTMATLAILDKSSKSLPPLTQVKELAKLKIWDDEHFELWRDIMREAKAAEKQSLARAAGRICASYRRRKLAKLIITEIKQSVSGISA